MDEWTGTPDPAELAAMRALIATRRATPRKRCWRDDQDRDPARAARLRAEFGPRGELRQAFGESGRAHLDRWLPFLVLHCSDEPGSSLARRVALNSPAYLIWSPGEEAEAAEALRAIAAAMRERLGAALLIQRRGRAVAGPAQGHARAAAVHDPGRRQRRRGGDARARRAGARRAGRSRWICGKATVDAAAPDGRSAAIARRRQESPSTSLRLRLRPVALPCKCRGRNCE